MSSFQANSRLWVVLFGKHPRSGLVWSEEACAWMSSLNHATIYKSLTTATMVAKLLVDRENVSRDAIRPLGVDVDVQPSGFFDVPKAD